MRADEREKEEEMYDVRLSVTTYSAVRNKANIDAQKR